jgi:hypothetical protein
MTPKPTTIAYDLAIGVDPGVRTGFAVWDCGERKLIRCETRCIVSAMQQTLWLFGSNVVKVIFEDARKRSWFGGKGREALQGAGSIKCECRIWEEFCTYYRIDFESRAPQKGATKWTDAQFKAATGWTGRTSEHARDAALLVLGGTIDRAQARKVAA